MAKTKMKMVDSLVAGDVVVTRKTRAMLKIHSVAGMPGDRILLGERFDDQDSNKGMNEAWPVRDLEQVRVLAQ